MESPSGPQLRMTVSPLRPTEWREAQSYGIEQRGGLPFMGGPGIASLGSGTHPLPLELLPEVAAVDLDSEDAVLAFVRSYGVLDAWPERFQLMRTADFGTQQQRAIRRIMTARKQHATAEGEFVEEFRVAAGGLVSMLATVRELERPRFSAARLSRDWSSIAPWAPPESKDRAWWLLFERINQGLLDAPLALWWIRNGEPTNGWQRDFKPGPPFLLHPATPSSLYGVCILELAEHLTANNPYRICANETCGRLFSVQEGRSRYGGHRTDNLKYHTPACKDAQAAREYRRRQSKGRTR